jgi:hypothetical protein
MAFVVLGALIALQIRARRSIRFSKEFWVSLLAFSAPLPIGLLFGKTAFLVAVVMIYSTFHILTRAPRMPEPGERDALRTTAYRNPEAARRLRELLRQEMKGHQLMREEFLPTLSPDERPAEQASIEQREQQTRLELQQLEDTIRQLKTGHGAA